ncbi:hypothetical protein LCGC14_0390540 [marine sediment metagenome]|uniref:Uncharacterized protein n=1 Tax=marine sediment metagenome TaxID=412755 RepID=A0A0F9T5I1_9ZZZZ
MKKLIVILILLIFIATTPAAEVKWTAISELTAINDADILVVVDDVAGTPISKKITVLNFFDTINSSSKLRAIVTDETGTGLLVFGTSPTFTTSIIITGANADPSLTGQIVYDNTIAGIMDGGALRWFDDDDSVRLLVDLETDPSNDDYVVAYDSTADGFYMKADADSGGSTAWDDIADPDNSGLTTITFNNAELSLLTGNNDAAASFWILQNTDADHTGGNFYLLDLDYSADDGDVDADYIKCQDSGGVVLTIQENGNLTTTGFLATGADPADQGAIRLSNATIIAWEDATETTLTHIDNVGLLLNLELEIDGTLDADGIVTLGDGGDNFSVASDGIDIDTSGNITNAGTIASGVVTVTGVINTSVGIDGVGAVDFDIGSGDILDVTIIENGGTYIFDNGLTAVGEDLGSATAEWNDLFLNDGGVIQLGNDQDVTITHVADTGIQMELDDSIMFGDTAVFIESDDDGFLDLDADTGIRLNAPVTITTNIKGEPKHLIFNVFNPSGVQSDDTQVCIWPETDAALTITKITVTLDAAGNEVAGDLKYADTFIGLASPVVINVFDTSSGVLEDATITSGSVAAGKAIYIQFDSAPNAAITQMCIDVVFDYD